MNKKGHVMNAILLGVGLGLILSVDPRTEVTMASIEGAARSILRLSVPVVLGALFPDVDTAFGRHRKTLHNLPVLAVFVAFPHFFGNLQFVWIGVATHYVLDAAGSRRGIAWFYPFSSTEYGLPAGVTTSSRYADVVTLAITALELGLLAGIHYYVVGLEAGVTQATNVIVF